VNVNRFISLVLLCVLVYGCDSRDQGQPSAHAGDKVTGGEQAQETMSSAPAEDSGDSRLEGLFRYMADAATFEECTTGRTFPVAMAGPYIELERAYLNSGIEPGAALKVAVTGRYLQHPSMESGSDDIVLVIDSFDGIADSPDCGSAAAPGLQTTFWKLIELNGEAVQSPEGAREMHLVLEAGDSRVHGFSGCNNFFGQYELIGGALSFSPLGSTMMACPEGMESEQAFLQALGATDRAEVSGIFLVLYALDQPVARFEASSPP